MFCDKTEQKKETARKGNDACSLEKHREPPQGEKNGKREIIPDDLSGMASIFLLTVPALAIGLIIILWSGDLVNISKIVGLADDIQIMILAIMISVGIMILSATSIGNFVDEHPTVKMLALSFLILVAVTLVAEGLDFHFPKGYIYFAMAFSFFVEMLNLRIRKKNTVTNN